MDSFWLQILLSAGGGMMALINVWLVFIVQNSTKKTADFQRALDQLRDRDEQLASGIAGVRELIAGDYVKRGEFLAALREHTVAISTRIDSLTDEIRNTRR